LEVCPSLTVDKPSLEIHPLGIGNREDPVRLKFTADPGPAVLVSLTDLRERFRLTANVVRVVEPDEPLPNLPVACAVWEPEPSFATSAECWLTVGGAHHTAMTTALGIDVWEDLATIAGVELAVIDRETTTRSFAQSMRLGQVYYRLALRFSTNGRAARHRAARPHHRGAPPHPRRDAKRCGPVDATRTAHRARLQLTTRCVSDNIRTRRGRRRHAGAGRCRGVQKVGRARARMRNGASLRPT